MEQSVIPDVSGYSLLASLGKTHTRSKSLQEFLQKGLNIFEKSLPAADVGVIMLWDPVSGLFRPEAAFGFAPEALKQMGLRAGESITGKVFDEDNPCLLVGNQVNQAMEDMREANRTLFIQSLGRDTLPYCVLAAPIRFAQNRFGVLIFESFNDPECFSINDLPLIELVADYFGLAIDRARLQVKADEIRQSREDERMKSEVMATLSHELRMPLTAIKGYSTALTVDEIAWSRQKQNEFLQLIEEECNNMESMIKDILDASLIDVAQLIIERQPIRLHHLAGQVANEAQRRTSNHRLIVDIGKDFPIVNADEGWIRQVFRNIIENAIKYSPDGGLIVVRGVVRSKDIVISVADQGIGISPEDLIPLFERYYRVKDAAGYHIPGTGLGLPIARSVVEAHGGRIWAESKAGEGTTLFFSLPKAEISEG